MKHGQDVGIGLLGTLFFAVLLIVGYHFGLQHFHGTSFKVFNYKVLITKCGPKIFDRVNTIEQKVKRIEKEQ